MPTRSGPPPCIPPQLSQLVKAPPEGDDWAHEVKYDGYRLHARLAGRAVKLLMRAALDWTDRC
jgi:bifunctional non-homologous end joining protein LigD